MFSRLKFSRSSLAAHEAVKQKFLKILGRKDVINFFTILQKSLDRALFLYYLTREVRSSGVNHRSVLIRSRITKKLYHGSSLEIKS